MTHYSHHLRDLGEPSRSIYISIHIGDGFDMQADADRLQISSQRLLAGAGAAILCSTSSLAAPTGPGPAPHGDRFGSSLVVAVSVGGTAGIQALADPANTVKLRATGRVGLYLHEYGMEILSSHQLGKAVSKVFAGTGPATAELGLSATRQDALNFFAGPYQALYRKVGFSPTTANVNGLDPTGSSGSITQWKEFAEVASRNGINSLAPFVNNNNRAWPNDFNDPFWNYTKSVAQAMGACALDTPPDFALRSGKSYLTNVVQVIRWCQANNLSTSVVISPNGKQSKFLAMTKRFYKYLLKSDALPSGWVVENFDDAKKPMNPMNIIASENELNSTTGVALWMAENAHIGPSPLHSGAP